MKKLRSSLGAKIAALALFIISLALFFLSFIGVFYMASENVYFDEGKQERKDIVANYLERQADIISMFYQQDVNDVSIESIYSNKKISVNRDTYRHLFKNYSREETNISFVICDKDENELVSNFKVDNPKYDYSENYSILINQKAENITRSFETYNERWEYIENCEDLYYDVSYDYYDEDTDNDGEYECVLNIYYVDGDTEEIEVNCYWDESFKVKDELYYIMQWFEKLVDLRYTIIAIMCMSFIVMLSSFIFLCCAAGHKSGVEGVHLNWADKIPLELYWGLLLLLGFFDCAALVETVRFWDVDVLSICIMAFTAFVLLMLVMAAFLSFVSRAKYGKWWKNTIVYKLCNLSFKWIKLIIASIGVIPKVVVSVLLICALNLLLTCWYPAEGMIILWALESVALVTVVIILSLQLLKLRKGIENIACGDFKTQIDTTHLISDLKKCGDSINSINNVLSREVNERMKSERFKTELITNVSHDIKTPLTSIINYVDIIKKKNIEDEELKTYLDVLDRQSGRLKKLIEDLVECSKAQTGNIAVHKTSIDIGVLLTQTVGEYQEKLEASMLNLVVEQPEAPIYISADGRLLWRVIDNLLNNACKYSLPCTRVYLRLEEMANEAVITLKNISKEQLNMTSDELMERFVRGDSSRNTEGSGLGLSIAKSLMELQQARMEINIDGDLFKVVLRFNKIGGEFVDAGNEELK